MDLIEKLVEKTEEAKFYNDYELNVFFRLKKIDRLYFSSKINYFEYKEKLNEILDKRNSKKELFSEYEDHILNILEQIKLINSEIFYSVYQNDFDFNKEFKIKSKSNREFSTSKKLKESYMESFKNLNDLDLDFELDNESKENGDFGISDSNNKEKNKPKIIKILISPFSYFFTFLKHGFYYQFKAIKKKFNKSNKSKNKKK